MTDQKTNALAHAAGTNAIERGQRIHQSPVSKAELVTRIANRAKPAHEIHLTPGGTIEHVVRRTFDAENERRIGFIEKRLSRAKGAVKARFNDAR